MKQTHPNNIAISQELETSLNVKFENYEFQLGGWGAVDNYCKIDENTFLFLEYERSQKHPNTNVLKVWPFLEENRKISVIFFHYFFTENIAPKNRVRLCEFIAAKMESEFNGRFQYLHLEDPKKIPDILKEQKRGLIKKLLTREVMVKIL